VAVLSDDMWDFIADLLSVFDAFPGSRVTVKDRYEMKRKVRELKNRERERAAADEVAVPRAGKNR
jgi:hypothetical protein